MLVRRPLSWRVRPPTAALFMAGFYVWGVVVQVAYDTRQLFVWTVCFLVLSMFLVVLIRMAPVPCPPVEVSVARQNLPRFDPKFLTFQVLILLLCIFVYWGLLSLAF